MTYRFWIRGLGISCLVGGIISSILGLASYMATLKTIEYLRTRPPGSNTPIITFDGAWYYIGIGISLIVIGILILLKYKKI